MADTGRQTIITPEDLGPQDVFVINDINLVVPPTQITVRKEDLVYRWRTLRTKSSTKIPTGHGRVDVHATIHFPAGQMLTLHRLLVEFRHSPFCYIDNRYLRETIVPDWPSHQNMAFTMTGIAISPMPGSSDTWTAELDMVWFNYFPYMHNFLYRQDWQTNWLYQGGGLDESSFSSYTIGWTLDLDTYERIHVPTPVEKVVSAYGSAEFESTKKRNEQGVLETGQPPDILHDSWSTVQQSYRDKGKRTIYDMEIAHAGVEWDLVPLPDNMMPSPIVAQPRKSRIYVRYINYLQRDALYKNFGINVEKDLLDLDATLAEGQKWSVDAFFGLTGENGRPETFGLHTNRVPRALRKKWIGQMLEHNHGVKFSFHALKEIRFPQGWVDKTDRVKNEVIANLAKRMGNILDRNRLQGQIPTVGADGGTELSIPVLGVPFRLTSPWGQRLHPTLKTQKMHGGIDLACPVGTPVLAPEAGYIGTVNTDSAANAAGQYVYLKTDSGSTWLFGHLSAVAVSKGDRVERGRPIGLSGNTGRSTGPHLHLGFWRAGITDLNDDNSSDPVPELERILVENQGFVGPLPEDAEPDSDTAGGQLLNSDAAEEAEKEAAKVEAAEELELEDEEADALAEMLNLLESEGWKYFDRDTSVLNIWEKLITLQIAHSGYDILHGGDAPERFAQEGVVLTNVSGSLSHIVANLPILSNEFPTQQHLGSIEPQYTMEFAVLDDRGDLEGISKMAQWLQTMRATLQKNARTFRPVTDGWCVATDTFITRLLGTYTENDMRHYIDGAITTDFSVRKRTVISGATSGTIEGNPGLSFIMFNMEETNPYENEVLVSSAPKLPEREDARKQILNAVFTLDFIDKYKKILLPTLVAQRAGGNTNAPGASTYGQFALDVYDPIGMDGALLRGLDQFILRENGNDYLLISKNSNGIAGIENYLYQAEYERLKAEDPDFEGPVELDTERNILGPKDDAARLRGEEVVYAEGIDKRSESADYIASFAGADGTVEYFKIPFTETGLADYQGQEDWLAKSASTFAADRLYRHYGDAFGVNTPVISSLGLIRFDIATLLDENPEFASLPIERILDYQAGLREIINTGNRMLAEAQAGGKSKSDVRDQLYELPFTNRMWQSWQEYLKAFVQTTPSFFSAIGNSIPGVQGYDANVALKRLTTIPGWPTPGSAAQFREKGDKRREVAWLDSFDPINPEDSKEVEAIRQLAWEYFGVLGAPVGGLTSLDDKLWGFFKSSLGAAGSENIDVAAYWRDAHATAIERLVNRYMRGLPLQIALPDFIKSKYNFYLGNLLGNFSDESNKVPALATMHEALIANAASCGNITALRLSGNPWFQVSDQDPFVIHRGNDTPNGEPGYFQDVRGVRGGAVGALTNLPPAQIAAFWANVVKYETNGAIDYVSLIDGLADKVSEVIGTDLEDYLYPFQQVGNPLNSEFKYPVNPGEEDLKVRYLKSLLSTIADDLLIDPEILRPFGLEHLAIKDDSGDVQGSECYPDMDLPSHPYYGDTFQVYPDFYMWNIYSDGTALNPEEQQKIYDQVEAVVENCYTSMKRMESGEHQWDERLDKVLGEPSVDDPIRLSTELSPEGTDAAKDGSGASASAFEPSEQANAAIEDFNRKLVDEVGDDEAKTFGSNFAFWKNGIRLSNTEGDYGAGGGVHYPSRVAPPVYAHLQEQVKGIENMFGSKAGHANQYLDEKNTPEIKTRTKDTNLERPIEYTHTYDLNSLKKLARDSAKDLLSQKMTLRRAFPTFKLFFVEEDEFEDRFLNFDDFYSYNAVKEFTVVQSRKLPADHAVITVQNVSGTLDGTKRNTIVDLDYFDRTASEKLEEGLQEGSPHGGNPITRGTAQDQPFGAVILRPGLNVQLRCGYSNDPDNLHVMISGRVVDVSWNKTGDLAEIMVQSFGTELVQAIKGTARDGAQKSYRTTHELLGSLMLEPEVVHFGRWEFGQLFQIGEASDFRLDFTDYSREGFMGRFKTTNALTSWVVNHPWMTLGVATGATLLNFLPIGRVFGGSKFAAGLLGRAGVTTGLGRSGLTRLLTQGAVKGAGAGAKIADDIPLSKIVSLADEALAGTYNVALKKAGSEAFEGVIRARMSVYRRAIQAAGNNRTEILEQTIKMERYLQTAIFKGQWMSKPWVEGAKVFSWSAIGPKPLSAAFNIFLSGPAKVATAAVGVGLLADLVLKPIVDSIYGHTVGRVRKFFTRTQAHLFLSPQDDNLFPPHPKDYMTLDRNLFNRTLEGLLISGSRILFQDDNAGLFTFRFFNPNEFLSKKVDPTACSYELVNTTIWQVFHEMSLRHPGWIYGPRPYGTKFRYTMFFGTPSQRYWSKPASNSFIDRMNQLRRFLEGRRGLYGAPDTFTVSENEFKALYSDTVYIDLEEKIEAGLVRMVNSGGFSLKGFVSGVPFNELNPSEQAAAADAVEFEKERILRREMTAVPLREYLRGLQIRFTPFRRYHLFTSERDIVWNGVMSSEQAVTNAVDVTYWSAPDQDAGETQGNIQTAVFKAHAFIPEHQLRIAPVRWANCNTYQMAMRYGMGELMHRMRDMYRGEIVLLGNPRIRPWDVGIVLDSYNDMVGPVEVEQVVHTFSHETGYITEIKPSAVVFGNEISGWPMVEAMKVFAVAIKDIEDRYGGLKIEDPEDEEGTGIGFLGTLAGLVNLWGSLGGDFESFTEEKYRRLFGEDGASLNKTFGGNPPNSESVDTALDLAENWTQSALGHAGFAMGSAGLGVGLAGTIVSAPEFLKTLSAVDAITGETAAATSLGTKFSQGGKALLKNPKAVAGGAAIIAGTALGLAGLGTLTAADKLDFPSVAWLIGGPLLFLHCLRNEAIIVVPLMKNGNPIVSGLAYNDPSMLWNNFRGELNRWVDDSLQGTRDMVSLYQRYGSGIWNRLNDPRLGDMTGEGLGTLPPA